MKNQGVNKTATRLAPRKPASSTNGMLGFNLPQKTIVGLVLLVALLAFELFNFDTTRYALNNLLGNVTFWGMQWATILAIAFCAIDFAGLARLFTPERGQQEPKAVWYLMGAWLLGATMNAVMTWWAVSLTLLSHEFGNEVLSREQLLQWVPFFVAALVWLTRILFIGAISVAGEYIFDWQDLRQRAASTINSASNDARRATTSSGSRPRPRTAVSGMQAKSKRQPAPDGRPPANPPRRSAPPRPGPTTRRLAGMQARRRR